MFYTDAAMRCATCAHMRGRDDEYVAMLLEAAEHDSGDHELHLEIANALFTAREYEDALEHFEVRHFVFVEKLFLRAQFVI